MTILALFAQPKIPLKRLVLHPQIDTYTALYGKKGAYHWIVEYDKLWQCEYRPNEGDGPCTFILTWNEFDVNSDRASTGSKYGVCENAGSDDDGDHWGLENDTPCYVFKPLVSRHSALAEKNAAVSQMNNNSNADGADTNPKKTPPQCSAEAKDPDKDGWAWQNNGICRIKSALVQASTQQKKRALDLSKYDGFYLSIYYEGRARYLDIRPTNHEPALEDGTGRTEKSMSALVHTTDLKAGPAFIPLSDFAVEEWWVRAKDVPRRLAAADFHRITSIGISHVDEGLHKMRVDRIELVGERLKMADLLVLLAIFWVSYLLIEAMFRYYQLRTVAQSSELAIQRLTQEADELEAEKSKLAVESITDKLTGVLNRTGILLEVDHLYGTEYQMLDFGVLIIDIDHFKNINDNYGHDVGDGILKDLAHTLSSNIRERDSLARWGGEEFVLLCKEASMFNLIKTAEKLRKLVESTLYGSNRALNITISIGLAQVKEGDSFEDTFKRADLALYRAKGKRNFVYYEY